ncbi:MAG: pyridoxine 5'-phosphate synthase [Chitinophagia bacterium]|nr:pyridoxine 5'-phosphate synthase [Chitinophagia bacterium]
MTSLSVNINKIATLRNSRGGNRPDPIQMALDAEKFGADGITVHPRPDERHIRYADVHELKKVLTTELNIEGNPMEPSFVELVLSVQPHQVTLVPDARQQLTSDHGWDTVEQQALLTSLISPFVNAGIRVSVFVDPIIEMIAGAKAAGAHRIELYTEQYARAYENGNVESVLEKYYQAALHAKELNLGINAGHDLDLHNLTSFIKKIPIIDEVSIGHALVSDALYLGWQNTIQLYQRALGK